MTVVRHFTRRPSTVRTVIETETHPVAGNGAGMIFFDVPLVFFHKVVVLLVLRPESGSVIHHTTIYVRMLLKCFVLLVLGEQLLPHVPQLDSNILELVVRVIVNVLRPSNNAIRYLCRYLVVADFNLYRGHLHSNRRATLP